MANKMLLVVILSIICVSVNCASFEETMKQTSDMMRQVCAPKFKITDEMLDNALKAKKIPDDKNFKCFVHCILEMMGMMKKNKVDFDKTIRQMETLLPPEIKPDWINAINICKESVQIVKNGCDLAVNILQCFVDNNPKFSM